MISIIDIVIEQHSDTTLPGISNTHPTMINPLSYHDVGEISYLSRCKIKDATL